MGVTQVEEKAMHGEGTQAQERSACYLLCLNVLTFVEYSS